MTSENSSLKIVIATGGSGGHIFPALEVARELRRCANDVIFVGAFGSSSSFLEREGFSFCLLSSVGLDVRSPVKFLRCLYRMCRAFVESWIFIRRERPNVVCGFGGYSSFAPLVVARLLNLPTLLHEQNVSPGKANRWLAFLVHRVALTFAESRRFWTLNERKSVVTGCPIHARRRLESKDDLRRAMGLDPHLTTILIVGGSQGSHRINQESLHVVPRLLERLNLQVIHICGKTDFSDVKRAYDAFNIKFCLLEFCHDMGAAYQVADCAVSRAGAMTILELAYFKVPAILIPYPNAGGHQKDNARVLSQHRVATIIEESQLSTKILKEAILALLTVPPEERDWERVSAQIHLSGAASHLAREIVSL